MSPASMEKALADSVWMRIAARVATVLSSTIIAIGIPLALMMGGRTLDRMERMQSQITSLQVSTAILTETVRVAYPREEVDRRFVELSRRIELAEQTQVRLWEAIRQLELAIE